MNAPRGRASLRSGAAGAAVLLLLVGAAPVTASHAPGSTGPPLQATTITMPDGRHTLFVAAGLRVALYASGLPTARFMALGPGSDVFVGSSDAGALWVLLHR